MRYTLLGPVQMSLDDMPLTVRRPRCRAVLAYLLLHANRVVSTQQLIEALWGGSEPPTARSQIQADVSALRKVCRDAGAEVPVHSRAPGYSITVGSGELDLDVFRAGMARARRLAERGDSGPAVREIREALALWHGTPLADISVCYADVVQTQLTSLRLAAYEELADLELSVGAHGALVDDLMPLAAAHPFHENLRSRLMLALYRSGRRTAALEQARKLRSLLAKEQGLTPGRSFTDLEQAILRADPSLDAAPAGRTVERAAAVDAFGPVGGARRGPAAGTADRGIADSADRGIPAPATPPGPAMPPAPATPPGPTPPPGLHPPAAPPPARTAPSEVAKPSEAQPPASDLPNPGVLAAPWASAPPPRPPAPPTPAATTVPAPASTPTVSAAPAAHTPHIAAPHAVPARAAAVRPRDVPVDNPPRHVPGRAPHRAVPMQLPPTPPLVGRRDQLERLDRYLAESRTGARSPATVAVVGPAGAGKTTLAVSWGRSVADRFPDGQLYLDLHGHDTQRPTTPAQTIARALHSLGVPRNAIPTGIDELTDLYRSTIAGKRLLALLDNARSVEQVRPLLTTDPGSATLITSRSRLTGLVVRDGARRVVVGPMTSQESEELLERILGADRLRAEPGAARSLAEAYGRLPLALSIAAANIANRPVSSVADHVGELVDDNRLTALQTTGDDESAMKTVLGQSYYALDDDTRRMFRYLGLVPGPDFTVAAAAALAGLAPADAGRLLERLLDAHLVEETTAGRFVFHNLTRLYARARAEAEESAPDREAARGRLHDWYLDRTLAALELTFPGYVHLSGVNRSLGAGFAAADEAMSWFDAEGPNLIAALHDEPMGAHTWRIADSLRPYFATRVHVGAWFDAANAAIRAAERLDSTEALFSGWYSLAHAKLSVHDHAEALKHFETAQSMARAVRHPSGEDSCENFIVQILIAGGRLSEAAGRLERTLNGPQQGRGASGMAILLSRLGEAYFELGRLADSERVRRQVVDLVHGMGLGTHEPYALANLAIVSHAVGNLDEAAALYTQALVKLRECGDADVESACLSELATVHLEAGRTEAARRCARRARRLAQGLRAPLWGWLALSVLATIDQDAEGHQQAIALAEASGNPGWRGRTLLAAAATAESLGCTDRARSLAGQALELAVCHGYRLTEGDGLLILARTQPPGSARALGYARRALAVHRRTGRRAGERAAWELLGPAGAAGPQDRPPLPHRQEKAPLHG